MAVPRRDLAAVAAGVAVAAAGGLDGDDSGGLGGGRTPGSRWGKPPHGKINLTAWKNRFTPKDIITMLRWMGYVENDKGYAEQESAHTLPVPVYTNKKIVYTTKCQLPRHNIDWGLDRGQEGEPMAIEMGLTLSKTRKDDQTGE
uniref:Uncharacterized protein n=1 Tax=Oryza sativa subsp. japonica TaxID=39947 RepID=Q75H79_ORYSJ|nr:hypothetical protein [Oryza sativa Japonica Group]AAR87346.1 hypothetical protein OSJNBa0034J04.21 [Oryza sativa Japonica Group]